MAWDQFTKMEQAQNVPAPITVSGTGRIVAIGGDKAGSVRHLPTPMETGSGAAAQTIPTEARNFTQKQAVQVAVHDNAQVPGGFWLPDWVRQHVDQNLSAEALVQQIVARVRQDPHEATLREAQALLNELGRSVEGTALIQKHVTPQLIGELVQTGKVTAPLSAPPQSVSVQPASEQPSQTSIHKA